ncbi:SIR2-like domain-containing protein [Nitrosomonas aestuarii]|uniref:SIR2-like domain-containing protein n=1 Tax=Nitrosomonas aestuarii TaxID=52441 RepID=A0A1I4FVM6_9PROT|nr:SIR2 family protein [Nitrosomonas aestuarii]SFL20721.1 SIR2-like domain-containing protein [Nitrosomonas aestuarii]
MTKNTRTHDAQKTLADLRDHLARHDKPIAFFFGAGTSCAIRVSVASEENSTKSIIPAVAGLTTICKREAASLGEKYTTAWDVIVNHCKELNQDPNIENILSRLRIMLNAVGGTDTLAGLKKDELKQLEESVRKSIAKVVTPNLVELQDNYPHRKLARWMARTSRQNPVEIFTVNYDVLIEHALEAERIPIFDGFVGSYQPFFHSDSLRRQESAPGTSWARLWKMHGSVTWQRITRDGKERVVRGEPNMDGEMIYPSFQKYDESRQQPYSTFADRLSRFLEQDDALLIVAGFNFGDEHINHLIFSTLENRPRTHVYALQFEELSEETDVIKRAYQRSNLIVIGPKTGIIGGQRAAWSPIESPAFLNVAFELNVTKAVDGEDQEKQSGTMKIGDFKSFCDLLESITAGHDQDANS